ncbi:hypothetical protein DPMN_084237 [Dreissena polymorpha]|uniref:Uncharacterized protein n=1 Tax=Dreissena polymorpha TaxID=45954 RepID=A0A9D3YDG8_DREPO|nr:hypothetical protein DPMN_084237 [Dreissena polymorpha]
MIIIIIIIIIIMIIINNNKNNKTNVIIDTKRSPWIIGYGVRLATGWSRVRSPLWKRSLDLTA